MLYTKTIRVPIHFLTTKHKLDYLDKLAARLTYAVRLWSEIIEENNIKHRKDLQNLEYQHYVQEKTKLSAGYVQQCSNKAMWMWKQYRKVHRIWKWKVRKAEGKWLQKLLEREPSKPFSNKNTLLHKIPVRLDYRTGNIKRVNLKLTDWVVEISTLKKNHKIALLLNSAKYHKDLLEKGKIRDFEIVKHKKYYVHIVCQYEVSDQHISGVRGVDLGISRDISTVLITQKRLKSKNFSIIKDVEKKQVLKKLNNRTAHLRSEEKWKVLKRLRHNRLNYAIDKDRKLAKHFVEQYCSDNFVVIGHPYYIRYVNYKGNGNKLGRKLLQGWAFKRFAQFIKEECDEQGILCLIINEWWTSGRCYKCNGKVKRITQSRIVCQECGMQYDADFNACIKIAYRGKSFIGDKSNEPFWQNLAEAADEPARTKDDLAQKSMNLEAISNL